MADPEGRGPSDSKRQVADALRGVIDKAAADREAGALPPPPPGVGARPWVAAVMVVVCVAVWLVDLPGIDVAEVPGPPPDVREAGLRIAIAIQARRIEDFRDVEHRVPGRPDEAGTPIEGIEYRRVDSATYELRVPHDGDTLVYHSSQRIEDFVGDAGSRFGAPAPPPVTGPQPAKTTP